LHLDGAAHGVNCAPKLDDASVTGALDHATVMNGDGRVDQVAAERTRAGKCSLLVGAGEPAVADYVSRENRSEFTSPRTAVPLPQRRVARLIALRRAKRRRCETGLLAVCDRL
jgi:hypothetical protein